MTQIKLDLGISEIASALSGVRAELEKIKQDAREAETALSKMAVGASKAFKNASKGSAPIMAVPAEGILDQFGLQIDPNNRNWAVHPNSVAADPTLTGFVTPTDRVRAAMSGIQTTNMQDLAQGRIGQLKYGSEGSFDKLVSRMEGKGASDVDRMIAQEAKSLAQALRQQTAEVAKLAASTREANLTEEELNKRRQDLAQATKKLADTTNKTEEAERSMRDIIRQGGGGSGGGGSKSGGLGGIFSRLRGMNPAQIASALSMAVEAVGGVGLAALGATNVSYGQAMMANMQTMQAAGQIGASQYQRAMGAMDLTRGENVVRYFGNLMSPESNFNYLGTQGRALAMAEAQEMTKRQLALARTERMESLGQFALSGATQIATAAGLGAAGGSFIPGLGTAAGAIAGGGLALANVLAGARGQYSNFLSNQYTQSQLRGDEWWLPEGAGEAMNTRWAVQQRRAEQMYMIDLQNAEMSTPAAQQAAAGYDMYRAGLMGRRAATAQVGGQAISGFERGAFAQTVTNLQNAGVSFEARNALELSPMGRTAASLGMSTTEYAALQNQLTEVRGGGTAERLVRLSRSGLGSSEQLLGNMMGLQQVAGTQGNMKALEDILAKAVSRGFDTAQFAQRFVGTVTELAGAVRTGNIGNLSQSLMATQAGMGGKGDLVSLQAAQAGMARLANITGQTTGLEGAVKAFGLFSAGGSIAGGAGIMQGMNIYQAQGAGETLGTAIRSGNFEELGSDPRTRAAIMSSRGELARQMFGKEWNQLSNNEKKQVLSRVQAQMGTMRENMLVPLRGVVESFGGQGAYAKFQTRAQAALSSGNERDYQQVLAEMAGLGSQAMGFEDVSSAMAAFTSDIQAKGGKVGLSARQQRNALNAAIGRGNETARDEALNRRQEFLNMMGAKAATDFTAQADVSGVEQYFSAGGGALQATIGNERRMVSRQEFAKMTGEQRLEVARQQTREGLIFGLQKSTASLEAGQVSIISGFTPQAVANMAQAFREGVKSQRSDDDKNRGVIGITKANDNNMFNLPF